MKTLQVRNVPDDLHRALKERAAREHTTMSDIVLEELRRAVRRPSPEQVLARIRARTAVGGPAGADLVCAARDER